MSGLSSLIGHIPHRMALAGGWIDQPFVSRHNPAPPGSMVVVSLQPDLWFMDRCGLAGGTRKVAQELWSGGLPDRAPAELVRELYGAENGGKPEPSGSQDMIGLIYPGVSRLDYTVDHEAGYFPVHIESNRDPEVARWIERVFYLVPVNQRPDGYNPLGVKRLDPAWIGRLGQSGKDCFSAIASRDLGRLGASMRECMDCWEAILPHMTLLRDLGCTHVVYADTSRRAEGDLFAPISRRPKLAEGEWDGYGKRLTALADRMADFGVGMAFHHHMGTIIETDAEIDRLMAVTGPSMGLLYDTGHCVFSGGDPEALLRRHVKRVVHVHCKDARKDLLDHARATDESFMQSVLDGVFTVPGDGFIDYPTLLGILHDAGYAGWIVCEAEQDPGKAHPLTYARLGFSNLVRMALQAGFTVDP